MKKPPRPTPWLLIGSLLAAHAATALPDYVPEPTLAEDVAKYDVNLEKSYIEQRPRLLFFEQDKAALQKRAQDFPELWERVITQAKSVRHSPLSEEVIRTGSKYWRVAYVQSGAMAWFVTGNESYRDGAIRWMKAICEVDIWGTGYRENRDLPASWYLYHIALAYDVLADEMPLEDRDAIRQGMAEHAEVIYQEYVTKAAEQKQSSYDQNHTYIPMTALTAAALTLYGEVPEAEDWLDMSAAMLRRSRYVQSEDGYYYEGFGYWVYAMHWHIRAAELMARATGEPWFDLPAIRENWKTALYLSLPGAPGAFDIGDTGYGSQDGERKSLSVNNHTMLWAIASATGSRESQTAGNFYQQRRPDHDYPVAAFLWFDPAIEPKPFSEIPPYHYFPDHGVVSWRSSWEDDATVVLFRCGPPLGHAATDKLDELTDWRMNTGHVHPDIGGFWLYARGEYLAVDTGYTARKFTNDHNTLLIDGKGQGADGDYHSAHNVDYRLFDQAKIDAVELADDYFYVSGEFGSVYTRQVEGVELRRTLVGTKDWVLTIDQMQAEEPRTLTWVCHSDAPFEKLDSNNFIAALSKAKLAVTLPDPQAPAAWSAIMQPSDVIAGTSPMKPSPAVRGHELLLTSTKPHEEITLQSVLLPLANGEPEPTIQLRRQKETGGYTVTYRTSAGQPQTLHFWQNPAAGQPHVKIE